MGPNNYDRPLYWYRKVDRHPDPTMHALSETFCGRVATWLCMEKAPTIYWFEEADSGQAKHAWSNDPGRKQSPSADPLRDPCEYFRWSGPPNAAFVGYTHHDSPLGIMVNVCRQGEELLLTVAHECFHFFQDVAHGAGWRKQRSPDVEKEADAFVQSKISAIQIFLEDWTRTTLLDSKPPRSE